MGTESFTFVGLSVVFGGLSLHAPLSPLDVARLKCGLEESSGDVIQPLEKN